MSKPVHDDNSPPDASDSMARVLALLDRHGLPPTPGNYAVWYAYVAGTHAELKAEIDRLSAENTPFTNEVARRLLHDHLGGQMSGVALNATGARIAAILGDLLNDLAQLGDETARYDDHLLRHLEQMQQPGGLQDLEALLGVLAEETKQMRRSTQALREEFELRREQMADLQAELQQVKRSANSDPLTGLPNRRALLDAMCQLAAQHDAHTHALLMLDIDHFKAINDQHGHLIGDRVIRFVADVIRQNTKGQDTPARFGGEEYAVLLPNTHLAGAITVAESIRHCVANARLVRSANQQPLGTITVSGGVAIYRRGEDSLELMERADQALYLAKQRGRNRIVPETEL